MREVIPEVQAIAEEARKEFAAKNVAREVGLARCRDAIRSSANCIRAVHRGEFDLARQLRNEAGRLLSEASRALDQYPDILHAGFVHDAEKEYAEASITLAVIDPGVTGLPGPAELKVGLAAYLNGMGEAVGELRRHLLDSLRAGRIGYCEEALEVMDEIFGVLVTLDYPDAMTGGLRRTTDSVRGILERTRSDLTLAARQADLTRTLSEFEGRLHLDS